VWHVKESLLLKTISAKAMSTFAALSPVMLTCSRQIDEKLLVLFKTNKKIYFHLFCSDKQYKVDKHTNSFQEFKLLTEDISELPTNNSDWDTNTLSFFFLRNWELLKL
jgi:hypothetical protein